MSYINKKQEEAIKNAWRQEAMKYDSTKLDKIHTHVLTAARSFHTEIKRRLTNDGEQEIDRVGSYNGEKFPTSLKENNTAMAWIMRVGNNEELYRRLFPNQVYGYLNSLGRLEDRYYKPIVYSEDRGTLKPELGYRQEEIELHGQYEEVLVVLRYLLTCDKLGIDILESLNIKPPKFWGKKYRIEARTKYYSITIEYTGNAYKPYERIVVFPHSNILRPYNYKSVYS